MSLCSFCGTQNQDDSKYCRSCGTRMTPAVQVTCRKCGVSNQAGSSFCHKCGERLVAAATGPVVTQTPASTPMAFKETPVIELDSQTETKRPVGNHLIPPPTAPEEGAKTGKPAKGQEGIPAWLEHLYETPPIKARLVPTHELLRMANAIGIDVDYSTLRFWQKRGLVPKPVRGPVDNGRGTRGYYDGSLIDRLGFIREIQKTYSMGLEEIRTELERIDQQVTKTPGISLHRPYQERLAVLQSQREVESRRTLLSVLSKALGLDPDDIATIVIRKKDGQTIRFLVNKVSEPEK